MTVRCRCSALVIVVCVAGLPASGGAQEACLLTPAELLSATGRAFTEGVPGVEAGSSAPLCHYAEVERPQRRLTIGLLRENPRARFEASQRLLTRGSNSIALSDVGDAAYFNGTAAGVLAADVFIRISNLRRGSSQDPEITPEQARALLRAALARARATGGATDAVPVIGSNLPPLPRFAAVYRHLRAPMTTRLPGDRPTSSPEGPGTRAPLGPHARAEPV